MPTGPGRFCDYYGMNAPLRRQTAQARLRCAALGTERLPRPGKVPIIRRRVLREPPLPQSIVLREYSVLVSCVRCACACVRARCVRACMRVIYSCEGVPHRAREVVPCVRDQIFVPVPSTTRSDVLQLRASDGGMCDSSRRSGRGGLKWGVTVVRENVEDQRSSARERNLGDIRGWEGCGG